MLFFRVAIPPPSAQRKDAMTYAHLYKLCPQAGGGWMLTISSGPELFDGTISQTVFKSKAEAKAAAAKLGATPHNY